MEKTAVSVLSKSRKKELFRKFLEAIILSLAKNSIALSDLQCSIAWLAIQLKVSSDVIKESLKFILSGKNKEKKPDGYNDFTRNFVKCYVSENLMKKDPDKITSPEKNITEEIKRLIVNTGEKNTPRNINVNKRRV